MPNRDRSTEDQNSLSRSGYYFLPLATALVYYFSNPKPQNYYDYTFRVAENFLYGSIGFASKPPDWLNEFVPFGGSYYSVFPLGSVLSMIPFAILKAIGMIQAMPGTFIASMLAGAACLYLLKIADIAGIAALQQVAPDGMIEFWRLTRPMHLPDEMFGEGKHIF